MPAGIEHPVLGYLGFAAVKFAGYSLAAPVISRTYGRTDRNPFIVGATRTAIGMAAGATYFGLLWSAGSFGIGPLARGSSSTHGEFFYLAGLLPVRIAEWWLLLWLFYDRRFGQPARAWRTVALATAWSYVLDAPAIMGFLVVGKVWIC